MQNNIEHITTDLGDGLATIQRVWFETRAEAEEQVAFYERMLNTISKSFRVIVRRKPDWSKDVNFETDEVKYWVSVRFAVLKGEPELRMPKTVYDDEIMLHGFGLPVKEKAAV